jgi:hypothetical protein
MFTIEVCERLGDHTRDGKPRYHAQLADHGELWGCGDTPSQAIGDLIRTHGQEHLGVRVRHVGKQSR